MTILKKLVCKSVKEELYCDEEYDKRFDTASACVDYEPRKKIRQKNNSSNNNSSKSQNQRRSRSKSKGRQMQIPHVIPEQAGIFHSLHPEFDDLSQNDFVVNAVRKSLNHRPGGTKPKSSSSKNNRRLGGLSCQPKSVDSTSTASSVTVDLHGAQNEKYYYGYGDVDESDAISQEGRSTTTNMSLGDILGLAPSTPSPPRTKNNKNVQPASPATSASSAVANYRSEKAEEDEGEGYLDQCMGMIADLMVGESAVPKDPAKRKRITSGKDVYENYSARKYNHDLDYDDESEVFKTADSQHTYTDDSSRDSFSSGQSSYEDSVGSTEFGSNLFCEPR